MTAARHLRAVDPATGELHDACPGCIERDRLIDELNRKLNGTLSQLGRLRADKDAEAREHQAWGALLALHGYWKAQTGHRRSTWTTDAFWTALPRLKMWGFGNLAAAVAGIAHDPNRRQRANGSWEVYDGWTTVFKNDDNVHRYIGRRPRGWTLPAALAEHAERWPRTR